MAQQSEKRLTLGVAAVSDGARVRCTVQGVPFILHAVEDSYGARVLLENERGQMVTACDLDLLRVKA